MTPADQELVIVIPLPPRETHPNHSAYSAGGTRARKRAVAKQREDACIAAMAEMNEPGRPYKPRWPRVSCQATFYRGRPQDRASDASNLNGWLKASEDGLQDAGVFANDRDATWEPPRQRLGKEAGGETKVVITVRPVER